MNTDQVRNFKEKIWNNILVLYLILSSGSILFGVNESIIVGGFSFLVIVQIITAKMKVTISKNSRY
jgi:hypothetical protein